MAASSHSEASRYYDCVRVAVTSLERKRAIVFLGISLAIAAYFAFALVSENVVGSTTETASNLFGPGEVPPRVTIYGGEEREGQLLGYTYDSRQTISELPDLNLANITSVPTSEMINVTKGSSVEFSVQRSPAPEARFDSLTVTSYTAAGDPVMVLDASDEPPENPYVMDGLESGLYVLLSTATWVTEENTERISGYVAYGDRINLVNR